MTTTDTTTLKFPRTRRPEFLSLVLRELTLRARGAYVAGSDSADDTRLKTFNELQNRVAEHLVHLLVGRRDKYPDSVLLQVLNDIAEHGQCSEDLRIAFEQANLALRPRR